jgi:hypothetical protein
MLSKLTSGKYFGKTCRRKYFRRFYLFKNNQILKWKIDRRIDTSSDLTFCSSMKVSCVINNELTFEEWED